MAGIRISICCVGKIKEKFYRDAVDEYRKRLSKYCRLEILEVEDEKTPDKGSCFLRKPDKAVTGLEQKILEKEGNRLKAYLKEDAYVIALDVKGSMPDSIALSEKIERLGVEGKSHIIFIIGGSLGLHESVLKSADYRLSFSAMTFPHQLMRVILLEQIYRSYRIMNNEPYHK